MKKESNIWCGWWRWPLVPIGGLLSAFMGVVVIKSISDLTMRWVTFHISWNPSYDGWDPHNALLVIFPLITHGIFAGLLTFVACLIAPRGKLAVGIGVNIFSMLILLNIKQAGYEPSILSDVYSLFIYMLAGGVGVLVASHLDKKACRRADNLESGAGREQ